MPIYEFYCSPCNTIYSFFSRSINTEKVPVCPRCKGSTLERRVSRFATVKRGGSGAGDDELGDPPIDEAKMESAMESLASEAEHLDENDPRAAAKLMRRLSESTGLEYNEKMQEALSRLESGEDPEAIEGEMGNDLEGMEDPFVMPGGGKGVRGKRMSAPRRDDTLYDM
jgi:putative FmdB family regulatory protein